MARRKSKKVSTSPMDLLKRHALKVALGLATTGAASTGGLALTKGDSIAVQQAVTATKVDSLGSAVDRTDTHLGQHDKALNRLDHRTTRMEVQQELMLDALHVDRKKRPEHPMGPEE